MSRVLVFCFIHGFKGTDNTFHDFPGDLKREVARRLPDHRVESVIYPQFETKGELGEATAAFYEWLKARVIEFRKAHLAQVWPPNDRQVGVVLVGHSMGGFVAAETLFLAVQERETHGGTAGPIFPMIHGILTFDTPFNGLARSMFVYGAFSNYQKVSSVFNAMTALSAAAPSAISRLGARRAVTRAAASSSSPAWKTWQVVAVKTGTVGAIAAGGVAAYIHREAIVEGVRSMGNLNKESVVARYRKGIDSIGQGLAYINRGNVGKSFAWLSDHFTFVGSLMKPNELARRLERIAALKGVGVHDFYVSLGENGYWSGGYFVPERTFCAVPVDETRSRIFERIVMPEAEDEVIAHMSMFVLQKNAAYEGMTERAAELVGTWFLDESDVFDDPKFREGRTKEEVEEAKRVDDALSSDDRDGPTTEAANKDDELPTESPIDIAAAASLVPLPDDGPDNGEPLEGEAVTKAAILDKDSKQKYLQYLLGVAEQAGTGIRGWMPSKVPNVQVPSVSSLTNVNISNMPMPSLPTFLSKKSPKTQEGASANVNNTTEEMETNPDNTSQ